MSPFTCFVMCAILTLWRPLLPYGYRTSECPDVKTYKWRLNPVWHRMLYSCTYMATVGVKGLMNNTTLLSCLVCYNVSIDVLLFATKQYTHFKFSLPETNPQNSLRPRMRDLFSCVTCILQTTTLSKHCVSVEIDTKHHHYRLHKCDE